MALGDDYATLEELKLFVNESRATNDSMLTNALRAASRGIEHVCGRQFNKVEVVDASPRVYRADSPVLEVDDFWTVDGLIVATDEADDGSFGTTWSAADYEPLPLNGVVNGQPGWPFYEILGSGSRSWPHGYRHVEGRARVRVTAAWGWAAVPSPVKQACLIVAAELFKTKDAPFGIAGNDTNGVVRVRENPMAMSKLAPYVRYPALVA